MTERTGRRLDQLVLGHGIRREWRPEGAKGNNSAILPADTIISKMVASLKLLKRVTASNRAPKVAGAVASNLMNSLITVALGTPR